jgi:hypothetical protein
MEKFQSVKKHIEKWIKQQTANYNKQGIEVQIKIDNNDIFRVLFTSPLGIGELIINQPDYAPYRFVDFGIVYFDENSEEIFWYDKSGDTVKTIIEALNNLLLTLVTKH